MVMHTLKSMLIILLLILFVFGGYGNYGGTAYVYDGYIEMQSDGSLSTNEYMTILVQFPSGTFNCQNKINKNFDYYLDMANEGSTQYSNSSAN